MEKEKTKKRIRISTIYILVSVLFWLSCAGYYGYRLVHYYQLAHGKIQGEITTNLNELMTKTEKISLTSEGLVMYNDGYLFLGTPNDNYVSYSGYTWRVLSIDASGNMVMALEDTISVMPFSATKENDYLSSIVYKYLNPIITTAEDGTVTDNLNTGTFYRTLNHPEQYLVKGHFCYDQLDVYSENIACKLVTEDDYVGLLNVNQYILSGAANGFLNNGTYFWTLTTIPENGGVYYVFPEGGIGTESVSLDGAYSYGVRPVVVLKANLDILGGVGTVDDPYRIDAVAETTLADQAISSYVNYGGYTWQIIGTDENGNVKLILNDVIRDAEGNVVKSKFGSSTYQTTNTLSNYLSKTFKKTMTDTSLMVKGTFYTGVYSSASKYTVEKVKKATVKATIGVPSMYDLYNVNTLGEGTAYWLTNYQDKENGVVMIMKEDGYVMGDFYTSKHAIRPVIYVKGTVNVLSGNGSMNEPFEIMETTTETEAANG